MYKETSELVKQLQSLLREAAVQQRYKTQLSDALKKLDAAYANKKMGYLQYEGRRQQLLDGKTRKESMQFYDYSIYAQLKQAERLLSRLFYLVYRDDAAANIQLALLEAPEEELRLSLPRPKVTAVSVTESSGEQEEAEGKNVEIKVTSVKLPELDIPTVEEIEAELAAAEQKLVERKKEEQLPLPKRSVRTYRPLRVFRSIAASVSHLHLPKLRLPKVHALRVHLPRLRLPHLPLLLKKKQKPQAAAAIAAAEKKPGAARRLRIHIPEPPPPSQVFGSLPVFRIFLRKGRKQKAPGRKQPAFFASLLQRRGKKQREADVFADEILAMETQPLEPGERRVLAEGLELAPFSLARFLTDLSRRFRKKQEPVLGQQTILPHVSRLRRVRKRLQKRESAQFEATLLAREAKRVRQLLQGQKKRFYVGAPVGVIANVTVKRISLHLIDRFPQVFGNLYHALRQANIKMLSHTYVNISVLATLSVSMVVGVLMFFLSIALNYPLYLIFLRPIIFGLLAAVLTAAAFYAYPFVKIKERRKSITVNLPFAINHISSVSASGVAPAMMFRLISEEEEYGEVSVELKKVVDLIDIFGYDILTAMRSVALTTPSKEFKEFLDGMVSTIEAGGDLDVFLRQKAEEATLRYQLERQRYNASVSTYSDIYTGLLIASPLFFLSSLAIINLLGGTVGGFGIDFLLAFGTYLVVPLLNIAFLVFLQMNQPEV